MNYIYLNTYDTRGGYSGCLCDWNFDFSVSLCGQDHHAIAVELSRSEQGSR